MKPENSLLAALLDDDAGFRETTKRQVRRLARRRRNVRRLTRLAGISAAVAVVAGLLLRFGTPESDAVVDELPGVAMIHSAPIESVATVETQPALFSEVRSSPAMLAVVATRPLDIQITTTDLATPGVELLNDRQLLAAFQGGRAALIDPGTERVRLILY